METIVCPLCNGAEEKVLFHRKDLNYGITDHEFRVVKCRDCGLAYVNPRSDQAEKHMSRTAGFTKITLTFDNKIDRLMDKLGFGLNILAEAS